MCALLEEQKDQADKEWPNCLASLLDFRAGKPPEDVHHLLLLAQKCISELKKKRPTMTVVSKSYYKSPRFNNSSENFHVKCQWC